MTESVDHAPELPHNVEVEQAFLGAIFLRNSVYEKAAEFLKPEDFYEPVHGRIYRACGELLAEGQAVDPKRLHFRFEKDEDLEEVGGAKYLISLAAGAPGVLTANSQARHIRELARRRELIEIAYGVIDRADDRSTERVSDSLIDEISTALQEIQNTGLNTRGAEPIAQVMGRSLEIIHKAQESDGLTGVPTGLKDLDRRLGGLQPGSLYIVAGATGMGKSIFGCHIARVAAQEGHAAAIASPEMSAEQLNFRMLSDVAQLQCKRHIAYEAALRGRIGKDDLETLDQIGKIISKWPIYLIADAYQTVQGISLHARRLRRDANLELLVIDYLQLLSAGDRYRGQRVNEVAEISRGLKCLARDLDIPVVALCQLSRKIEMRDNKRPMLSDLRESGAIEQDADAVLFLHRDEYWLRQAGKRQGETDFEFGERIKGSKNKMDLIVGKQRNGPTGTSTVFVNLETSTLRDLQHG